ncbi:RagB/SusD family nutrient uptake outer membrane protein [Spirosoma lituiforme]
MKKYNRIVGVVVLLSFVGTTFNACTKLQDENYTQLVSSAFTPTTQDLASLVGPAYGNWRPLMMQNNGFFRTNEISADELVIPSRPNGWVDGGIYRRMHEHKWTAQEGNTYDNWNNAFGGITNANRVIYQVESGQIPITQGKDALLAELRVLRASYYYVLCDIFGNVPIVTKFNVEDGFLPDQSSRVDVYNFIVKELTESLPLLSDNADKSTYGRFNNKWAAYALLAKMYLNAQVFSGTAQWDKCAAACDAIINSGKFQLETNQKDVFKTLNENSKEIVFAIPYDEIYGQVFSLAMETLQPANQKTYGIEAACWGGTCAIPQFINTYDPDDSRLKDNWIQGQQYDASGQILLGSMRATNGKPLIYVNAVPGIDSSEEVHGYRLGKYEFKQGLRVNMSNDVPLFRYADVLMMKAECLLRTGKADEAATIVSQIRQRSFKNNPTKATVTSADLMKGSVYKYGLTRNGQFTTTETGTDVQYGRFLDELGWEFTQEGRRRQDMIRFGIYTKKSWLSHTPNGDYRILLPIPQAEINKNPKLKQNPGY